MGEQGVRFGAVDRWPPPRNKLTRPPWMRVRGSPRELPLVPQLLLTTWWNPARENQCNSPASADSSQPTPLDAVPLARLFHLLEKGRGDLAPHGPRYAGLDANDKMIPRLAHEPNDGHGKCNYQNLGKELGHSAPKAEGIGLHAPCSP